MNNQKIDLATLHYNIILITSSLCQGRSEGSCQRGTLKIVHPPACTCTTTLSMSLAQGYVSNPLVSSSLGLTPGSPGGGQWGPRPGVHNHALTCALVRMLARTLSDLYLNMLSCQVLLRCIECAATGDVVSISYYSTSAMKFNQRSSWFNRIQLHVHVKYNPMISGDEARPLHVTVSCCLIFVQSVQEASACTCSQCLDCCSQRSPCSSFYHSMARDTTSFHEVKSFPLTSDEHTTNMINT